MKCSFYSLQCGELCSNNSFTINLPDSTTNDQLLSILEDLNLQGWQIKYINNKLVYTLCNKCLAPIMSPSTSLCNSCNNDAKQLTLEI